MLEPTGVPEGTMLVSLFDVTVGKAKLAVSLVAEVIEPAPGGPA